MSRVLGIPHDRVDGPAKVTGGASFAADYAPPGLVHSCLIRSTIARGRTLRIGTGHAERAPGFLAVLTHENAPPLKPPPDDLLEMFAGQFFETRPPLRDEVIHYAGQPLGVIVAETAEQARYAASLVTITYDREPPVLDLEAVPGPECWRPERFIGTPGMELQVRRGEPDREFDEAEHRVERTYRTSTNHHNPIETSATVAEWEGGKLTLHDSCRWVQGLQRAAAHALGLDPEAVRVISPFIGGAFGAKGFLWNHVVLAAVAARSVARPVKLVLTRADMYSSTGHRPRTVQRVALGATGEGRLTAIRHDTLSETSPVNRYVEPCGLLTRGLYASSSLAVTHRVAPVNIAPPLVMRAPGEAPGLFALESAMDELAEIIGLDPLEIRLRNHADHDLHEGRPWSSKHLRECYRLGAERFGWSERPGQPRSMRDGDHLVGWGMATAAYPGNRRPASAKVSLLPDDTAVVATASHELGNGAATVLTQIAAEALGLPTERVRVDLGDSTSPQAPATAGSWTTASVGSAVRAAAEEARAALIGLALSHPDSPLHGASPRDVIARDGRVSLGIDPSRGESFGDIMTRAGRRVVEVERESRPGAERSEFSFESYGALFAEVKVDPLGQVRATRLVGVYDVGAVLNPKSAHSQLVGGIVMGVGMAFMERTAYDPCGRVVNDNLAEYAIPVNADIPAIDATLLDEPDPHINALGARGVGELALAGVAAALANAVHHATGKRIRDLPIIPEKLL
ncbi:xanthine dehydrogenase family protein molybdopterin-binding subunit [Paludisphaera borealis]|uniref:Xanthine dehydrogenase molybdenum-binding subunit n=1 Tax=Paludisphaera borealis TaxID=1387353 RepID=A0A1U7CNK7_9BACT|nr:xanthine dehydrogenase family protein molybdopterin-binding subunit [Paludisphaera borealis]APW60524.1 Xanthine dehydrogenase molybdenum-binding subunit [Paludisphaera borealis]